MITSRSKPHCVIMLSEDDCAQLKEALEIAISSMQADIDVAAGDMECADSAKAEATRTFVDAWLRHRGALNEVLIAVSRK